MASAVTTNRRTTAHHAQLSSWSPPDWYELEYVKGVIDPYTNTIVHPIGRSYPEYLAKNDASGTE